MKLNDVESRSPYRVLTAACVMATTGIACLVPSRAAEARPLDVPAAAVDTIPVAPPTVEVEIAPPPDEGLAAVYAKRYRISPSLALQIIQSARQEGLDPELGFRLIRVESVFRPNARGSSGSLGLTQLMPSTARAIDRSVNTEAEILDPKNNLRLGFRYLRRLIDRYNDVRLGVLAYNRGETAVDRALRAGRDPENGYSGKVLNLGGDRYTGTGRAE